MQYIQEWCELLWGPAEHNIEPNDINESQFLLQHAIPYLVQLAL